MTCDQNLTGWVMAGWMWGRKLAIVTNSERKGKELASQYKGDLESKCLHRTDKTIKEKEEIQKKETTYGYEKERARLDQQQKNSRKWFACIIKPGKDGKREKEGEEEKTKDWRKIEEKRRSKKKIIRKNSNTNWLCADLWAQTVCGSEREVVLLGVRWWEAPPGFNP